MTTEFAAQQTTVQGRKETLVNDLKGAVAHGEELLKEMVNSSAEEFALARKKVEGSVNLAKFRLDDARMAVTEGAIDAAEAAEQYVRKNPWKILGVAAAAGLVVSYFVTRR